MNRLLGTPEKDIRADIEKLKTEEGIFDVLYLKWSYKNRYRWTKFGFRLVCLSIWIPAIIFHLSDPFVLIVVFIAISGVIFWILTDRIDAEDNK